MSEEHIKILEEQQLKLEKEIADKLNELKGIRIELRTLKGDAGFPWAQRALKCINSRNELLSTADILEGVLYYKRYELNDPIKRQNYISILSVALNKLCKSGKIFREPIDGIKGNLYGLSEWRYDDNTLKTEYKLKLEYKKRQITNNKRDFMATA